MILARVASEQSTTPDLVELARQAAAAANRRDLDALMRFFAPDAIYDLSPVGMGSFRGRAAIRGLFEEWWGTYEDWEFELEEIRDLGGGVGFFVSVARGRLPDSTGWMQLRYATAEKWQDGRIERVWNYSDVNEARAAAGRLAQERADG